MWNNQGDYSTSGGDYGGGYLAQQSNFGSPALSQERKGGQKRNQNVVPCTVGQIMAAQQQDDKFVFNGVELHQITLVGMVQHVKETNTWYDYLIDDATGPLLDVKQFVDNDENTPDYERTASLRENTYVRVLGHVRTFNNKRHVVAFKVMPVTDPNEITSHILEVVRDHMLISGKSGKGIGGGHAGGGFAHGGGASSYGQGHAGPSVGSSMYSGASAADQGLSSVQKQVIGVIRSAGDSQAGASVQTISERLRGLPPNAIRDALEFLSNEGHIYSTIDEEHFKTTDS